MADVWPKHLTPDDAPWARKVESGVKSNTSDLASLRKWSEAQNQGTAASLDALRQQIVALQDTNQALADTVSYLQSLAPVYAISSTGGTAIANNTWTTDSGLRPSVGVVTPSGRIKITMSALISSALVTYSIPSYVSRSSTDFGRMLSQGSSGGVVSRTLIQDGLPANTPLTVQAEAYGTASGSPVVGYVALIVEPVP